MSAVGPREGEQPSEKMEQEGESDVEEKFMKVFGERVEDTLEALKEKSEEANAAKGGKTEAVPSAKEVEENSLDQSVSRSWCPRCVKGRAEAYGHRSSKTDKREAPVVGVDYMYMRSEREQEEEKGMTIIRLKDQRTNMIAAKVLPSNGVDACAVESVRRALEQLGHRRIILRSDSEPAILALKEAVRRERERERAT